MTLHNYRSRQVHETLNGVNPSSAFRDMHSAKSGPNLWQIWQVFGPWASPYGANGQMTVHNYRPRQLHRTLNGENPSSGDWDMGSAILVADCPPGPCRQYPSSPEGWWVKTDDLALIWAFPDGNWNLNSQQFMTMKWYTQILGAWKRFPTVFEVTHQISRSHGLKNPWNGSDLGNITKQVAAIKSLRFALLL